MTTTNERAEDTLIRLQRNSVEARQIGIIQKAIEAAIEEDRKSRECCKQEREACARIADHAEHPEYGIIAKEIRARSES